jgi:hypothetical protein
VIARLGGRHAAEVHVRDQAGEALVGDQQVAAAAQQEERKRALFRPAGGRAQGVLAGGADVGAGRSPDAQRAEGRQGHLRPDG